MDKLATQSVQCNFALPKLEFVSLVIDLRENAQYLLLTSFLA